MFICMCECVCAYVCVCLCVCLPACLVCGCVYLFMNSVGVFVCTVPLFRQKIRRHLLGDSKLAVKNRKESVVGERKKNTQAARDISILAPCFPQGAGRRLQNGSTPCHRVGSALSKCLWMENTAWKVSPFLSLPHCFSLLFPSFSLPPLLCPPSVHPSSHTERASHPLQWSSHWMLPLLWEKHSLSPSVSLARWSSARALCLGEVSASHSEVHSSLKHDVYLLGPVCRTVKVLVPLSRAIMICVADRTANKTGVKRINRLGSINRGHFNGEGRQKYVDAWLCGHHHIIRGILASIRC